MSLDFTEMIKVYDEFIEDVEKRIKLTKKLNKVLFVFTIVNFMLSVNFGLVNFVAGSFSLAVLIWCSNNISTAQSRIVIHKELRAEYRQDMLHTMYNYKK